MNYMPKATLLFLLLFPIATFAQRDVISIAQKDSLSVKELFFAGLKEKLLGNEEAATLNFKKVLTLDKSNDAALYELANANLKLNHLLEAAQYATDAADLKPNNKYYLQLLAEIYKASNNISALDGVLNNLIKLDPENRAYYFDKANVQLLTNKEEEAKATYNTIEQKFGASASLNNARSRLQSSNDKSGDIVKLLGGANASMKEYLYAAHLLIEKGNTNEALTVLQKADALSPNNYELKLAIADVYRKQSKSSESFEALKSAFESADMPTTEKIQIVGSLFSKMGEEEGKDQVNTLAELLVKQDPTNSKIIALYADILFRQDRFAEALKEYKQSLKLNDQVFAVWEGLINTHNLMGQYKEAIKVSNDALTLYPNQASLYYFLAYAQYRTDAASDALKNVASVLTLGTEDHGLLAQSYALKADILIDKGNFEEAKKAFYQAIKEEPDNYQILTKVAYFLALRDEDLSIAEGYAEVAAKAKPDNPAITDTYAFVLFKQKKYLLAKQWVELAIQNKKTNHGVYLEHYGDILYFLDDRQNALLKWKMAKDAGNTSKVLIRKINEKKFLK